MAYREVTAASSSNIDVATAPATVDGRVMSNDDLILLLGQTNQVENGMWRWMGQNVALQRPIAGQPYETGSPVDNATLVWVTGGDTLAGKVFGISPARRVVTDTDSHTLAEVALPPVQVRLATASKVGSLSAPGAMLDGVALSPGDLVLLKDQGDAANGLYLWSGAALPLARSPEPLIPNRTVFVSEGNANAHSHWKLVTQGPLRLGSTTPIFSSQNPVVNARDFGALGNASAADDPLSGADDTDALQAAIDFCLNDTQGHPKLLYLPGGTYRITRPLVIMKTFDKVNADGSTSTAVGYCAIHIFGEKRSFDDSYGDTRIYAELNDGPAMVIQGGFGVIVRGITFSGVNRYDVEISKAKAGNSDQTLTFDVYENDLVYNYNWDPYPWSIPPPYPLVGPCCDNLQSPHAGIAIDPFSPAIARNDGSLPSGVPPLNQYPSLGQHYAYDPTGYHYSTAVVIEDCMFSRFVVGIAISPTGRNANAENIVLRNLSFRSNKICLAVCQSQTRGLQLENCAVLQCHTVIDNRTYGAGTEGSAPHIRGLTVSEAKFLFNIDAQVSALRFEHIYAEATLSLGYLGAESSANQGAITIAGSTFDFQLVRPAANTHCSSFASLRFVDCMFSITGGGADEFPPLMFHNKAPLVFENCQVFTGRVSSKASSLGVSFDWGWANSAPAWGFNDPSLVRVNGVRIRDNVAGGHLGSAIAAIIRQEHLSVGPNELTPAGLVRQVVPPGARVAPAAPAFFGETPFHRWVRGDVNVIPIGSVDLKRSLTGGKGSLSFSGPTGLLLPGDVVYLGVTDAFQVPKYPKASISVLGGDAAPLNPTSGYPTTGPIGVIISASGGSHVVGFVPVAFWNKAGMGLTATLHVRRFGRYHPATVGDIRSDSTTLSNVAVAGYGSAATVWKPGDRISTDRTTLGGMPIISAGTYVVSASANTVTLSRLPNGSATGVPLFDAQVFRFAGTQE